MMLARLRRMSIVTRVLAVATLSLVVLSGMLFVVVKQTVETTTFDQTRAEVVHAEGMLHYLANQKGTPAIVHGQLDAVQLVPLCGILWTWTAMLPLVRRPSVASGAEVGAALQLNQPFEGAGLCKRRLNHPARAHAPAVVAAAVRIRVRRPQRPRVRACRSRPESRAARGWSARCQ